VSSRKREDETRDSQEERNLAVGRSLKRDVGSTKEKKNYPGTEENRADIKTEKGEKMGKGLLKKQTKKKTRSASDSFEMSS